MKLLRSPIISLGTTTLIFVSFTSDSSQVLAQAFQPFNNFLKQPLQQEKQKSSDYGKYGRPMPGRRVGGGSRGPCPYNREQPLTALMPTTNWGETVAEHPTFWFYVPYSSQNFPAGEFVLHEEAGKEVYRIPFTLPATPGLVKFSIPSDRAPLEIDKKYFWTFKLYCQPQQSSASDSVQGWVTRIKLTPELQRQIEAAKPREDMAYNQNRIWYDALARLAEIRTAHPSNSTLDRDWTELLKLKGIGLEHLAQRPLVGSVTVQSEQAIR